MNTFFICEIDLFCILILLLLLWTSSKTSNTTITQRYFRRFLIFVAIFCSSEILDWILRTCAPVNNITNFVIWLANLIYFISSAIIASNWFFYIMSTINDKKVFSKKRIIFVNLPVAIFILTALSTPFTKFIFTITDQNEYQRRYGVIFHLFITFGYITAGTIYALYHMSKENDSRKKRYTYLPLILFVIPPMIASVLQLYNLSTPVLQISLTLDSLLIFLSHQTQLVSKDPLTGLNNRGQYDKFMDHKINELKKDDSVLLAMIDVDNFKTINDRFGHLTGDKALVNVASILEKTNSEFKNKLFISRYGGDEFVITQINPVYGMEEKLQHTIDSMTEEVNSRLTEPFEIGLSVGIVIKRRSDFERIEDLAKLADKEMYKNKKIKKGIN